VHNLTVRAKGKLLLENAQVHASSSNSMSSSSSLIKPACHAVHVLRSSPLLRGAVTAWSGPTGACSEGASRRHELQNTYCLLDYRRGKSTLMRLLATRQLPVPETLDVLLVEQEVVGTELTALEVWPPACLCQGLCVLLCSRPPPRLCVQAVVAADVELMELRAEEVQLLQRLENPETAGKEVRRGDLAGRTAQRCQDC
jgi:hypothetical protein